MFDPFEYLVARHKDGLLKTDFKQALGKVSYHIPCHGRVQKIGKKTEEMLKLIGQSVTVQLNTVERCSGHAGTYGVKTPDAPGGDEDRQAGVQGDGQGRARLHQLATASWPVITSRRAWRSKAAPDTKLAHPLSLVRIAYGLA
jgi:glycerol-3-phosphate dehydrogenase subunit C